MSELSGRQRLDDMPGILRWALVSIKEVGFPIVCCVILFYLVFVNNDKMTSALNRVSDALGTLQTAVNTNQKVILKNQKAIIKSMHISQDDDD